MTVAHANLTGANLHEPKGASSAVADSFYVATGAGSGSWKKRLVKIQATLTPAAAIANTSAEQTFTFTGAVLATDFVIGVTKPTHQAGLGIVGARVTADNTIGIAFMNNTGSNITPTAGQVYTAILWRD